MALILTLGLLTVLTLAVVAFVITMRVERLASGHVLNRTKARQHVDAGLSEALSLVNATMAYGARCYPVQGWSTNIPGQPHFFEQDCFGCPVTNETTASLFRGSATTLLPALLATQASQVASAWIGIVETNDATGSDGIKAGRVTFLVANLSGMLDVHALNADRCQALGEPNASVTDLLNATGMYQRVFLTQPDLVAANGGPVSNLVTFSYDPGPDVYFTSLTNFGTRAFANDLHARYNINLATNVTELVTVSNLLANADVPLADATAWNIWNYLDAGRIPFGPGPTPAYRSGIGVKDVPLINEIALEQINGNPEYGVSVELWYPFVPHTSPDDVTVSVGVYTNLADATAAIASGSNLPLSPMSFEKTPVPLMNYEDQFEFFVASTTNAPSSPQPISFREIIPQPSPNPPLIVYHTVGPTYPVWILARVYVDDICVDEALAAGNQLTRWERTGSIQFGDPRTNQCAPIVIEASSVLSAPTLGTTNNPCTIPSLPLVHANAPMRSAGELRYIFAPGLPGGRIDFTTALGGACRDRFTIRTNNAPIHGLIQANTPYPKVWQAILSDITVGWTSEADPIGCFVKLGSEPDWQQLLASSVIQALSNTASRGWVCNEEMFSVLGTNLLNSVMATNQSKGGMDAQAVCNDILAGIADRVSFRQNTYLVIVCGQRTSPLGRVLADQRAACTIVRDAYTGRWVLDHMVWLTE